MRHILLNLLSNAVRHTDPQGEVSVGVDVVGDRARIVVADDGEGMDPETRRTAFERFSRGSARRGEGSGLGLAIVAALAKAQDGDVHLESAPGRGTTVEVLLPREPTPRGPHRGGRSA